MDGAGGCRLPGHVAVIMDGNGRWAERQGLARTDGHSRGEERLAEIVRASDALGIGWLTAYGFSTENWRRPRLEVDFILGLHKKIFGRRQEMHANNVKIRWIGRDTRAGSRIPAIVRRGDREVDPAHRAQHRAELHRRVRLRRAPGAGGGGTRDRDRAAGADRPVHRRTATCTSRRSPRSTSWCARRARAASPTSCSGREWARTSTSTPTLWPDFGAAELDAAIEWWRKRTE